MSWRVRLHPQVSGDLDAIAQWIIDYAGPTVAARKLDEIERVIAGLAEVPARGTRRDDIAPGLRVLPAGRRAVVAFTLDEAQREARVVAVVFGGADWMRLAVDRT